MINTHLFLFTLGPVQSFIAQARKTQDLYAGSAILSDLIRAGIAVFKHEFAAIEYKIIFPGKEREGSMPNRFIGKIVGHSLTDTELLQKAGDIKLAVEKKFVDIAKEALGKAEIAEPPGFEQQIKAHLDIFWTFQVVKDNDYAMAFKALESLGAAIKNVRTFEQFTYQHSDTEYGEVGRKCSVDGINNTRFYRPTEKGSEPAYVAAGVKKIKGFSLNPGEGLSAVSLVKRFYPNTTSFPSTAAVALMHDESKLTVKEKEMLGCYKLLFNKTKSAEACIQMLTKGWIDKCEITNPQDNENWNDQFDHQMLFEENLTSKNIPDPSQLDLVRHLNARLKPSLKTKYYAIVRFDGDKMGKWLSGANNKTERGLEPFHEKLSCLLSDFGTSAANGLNNSKQGHAVYAGGDDFLGFVNVHYLFDVMTELRMDFHKTVNMGIEAFKKPDEEMTFSAGIVIAHYKTPFSEVLKKAREIEKKAKKEGGRNAFGITVLKHSGEVQEAVFKWDEVESSPNGCSNWEAFQRIKNALDKEKGRFSNSFIVNLTNEFYQLTGADLHDMDSTSRMAEHLENALLFEIKRLVHRSLDKPATTKAEDDELKDKLTEAVQTLWKQARHPKTRNFIHALHIIDFITRKTDK